MEKIISYAFIGTVSVLIWNISSYFIKRIHSKKDKKKEELSIALNNVLDKTIDIRTEIIIHNHKYLKDLIIFQKEISLNIENESDLKTSHIKFIEKFELLQSENSQIEIDKFIESKINFQKLSLIRIDEISKSLELKANDLIRITLNSLNISLNIRNELDKLPYLIQKHIINRQLNDDLNLNIENIDKILQCAYELEDLVNGEIKKL
ncbi:hypothetical protein LPB03_15695 [Polaribacter vadi]|uniref:Uncharacterized protein n=1 Tax=Polaribacter vadi TaxID=1774273 RepID=A0A1B8TQA8_9FLAO|nr:hypothetical protein [Polaribacter vadi]AOW18806.1 hypothetical protein LPB03_15695 [Polaribacter vadi]OBY61829.1 hypothetical protein LPB3_13605 [Polaribacter vadi]